MSVRITNAIEEYPVSHEDIASGISLEKVLLRRHPRGEWALSGTIHVRVPIDDTRRIEDTRPFHVRFLTEEADSDA